MKTYFYVNDYPRNNNPEVYETIEKYKEIIQFPESYQCYWCDIKFIRKLKISNLEGSTKYNDIIELLFSDKITFTEYPPTFGTSGMSGTSGTSGISGVSHDLNNDEYQSLLDELVKNMIEISKVPKEYFNT